MTLHRFRRQVLSCDQRRARELLSSSIRPGEPGAGCPLECVAGPADGQNANGRMEDPYPKGACQMISWLPEKLYGGRHHGHDHTLP